MIGRPPLQPTSSMMMVALFSSQRRISAVARFAYWTSSQVVGLDLFSGRLFSGKTGGFQANYMAKIVRQRALRTRAELARRSRRMSCSLKRRTSFSFLFFSKNRGAYAPLRFFSSESGRLYTGYTSWRSLLY